MIVPLGEKVHLPSDLSGITVGEYKRRIDSDESMPFDVSAACIKIINAIKKIENKRFAQAATHEKFWKGLADRVVILYGAESGGDVDSNKRPRVSLRDLDTMTHILRFLTRWYPHKQVIPLRAGTPVLPNMLQEGTDLIIIGGFITNEIFAKYQANYKGNYRLEMGGL